MRISILTQVYKPVINGVVRSVENFSRGLRELGQEVYVIAPGKSGEHDQEENVYRWKLGLSLKEGYCLQFPVSREIGRILKTSDIIHVQHPFVAGQVGKFRAKLHDIPLVFTYHTMYEDYAYYFPFIGRWTLFKRGLIKFVTRYADKCDCVIAPSGQIRQILVGRGVKARIEVVPSGIDMSQFENADGRKVRRKHGLEGVVALYLGRVAEEKNIDLLIDVFNGVFEKNSEVQLVIAGPGDAEEYRKRVKKEYIKRVVFAGRVKPDDVPKYYAAADFFVSASTTETQGLTYVEAQAAGLPVIAMKCMGSREIVDNGKNGFIVSTKEGLCEGVLYLIKNEKERADLGKRAKDDSRRFAIGSTSQKLLEVYKSLATSFSA